MPLSWLYGIGVRIRNWMFDIGMLKSQSYDIPIISVGNITVGVRARPLTWNIS